MIILIVLAVIVIALLFWPISIYNNIARGKVKVEEGWSDIGVMLQQRNDLIPNLVETVKGYAAHEQDTLTNVIKWRNMSAAATTPAAQGTATAGLSSALANLQIVSEKYPDLKANENFQQLQSTLSDLEEKINYARRYYNGTVREYNTSLTIFPNNFVANFAGAQALTFFEEDAESHVVPKISFDK